LSAAKEKAFGEAVRVYRSTLDGAAIPNGLEQKVQEAFVLLCESASTKADLVELSGAMFNCTLPQADALLTICKLMVAVNRIVTSSTFPDIMLLTPNQGDEIIPLAAALAVAAIKEHGNTVGEGFRSYASTSWMTAFRKLSPNHQALVRSQMAIAWKDAGQQLPPHLFEGFFAAKTFEEIRQDLISRLPKTFGRPLF
jgi:hypothetical protein